MEGFLLHSANRFFFAIFYALCLFRLTGDLIKISLLKNLFSDGIHFSIHLRSLHTFSTGMFTPTKNEQEMTSLLAHRLIKEQEKNAIVGIWPLVCLEINRILAYELSDSH